MDKDTPNLDERLTALNKPREGCLYFAITLTADENFKVVFGTQTQWAGWADPEMRHELREARLVYPEFVKLWIALEQPYAIIHTIDELTLFLVGGGNALVEENLAKQVFGEVLSARVSIPHGPAGFLGPGMFESTAFRRAPTPKIRMQVLNRDDRRCRICGRRPDDNTDLVLHVHHIRPWEKGGVTDPTNLITLCHTCHSGLMPHEDRSLFEHISDPKYATDFLSEFAKGVENYRKVGFLGADEPNRTSRRRRPRGDNKQA
jgi:HNH endonuclease